MAIKLKFIKVGWALLTLFKEFLDKNRSLILLDFLSNKVNATVDNKSVETYFKILAAPKSN